MSPKSKRGVMTKSLSEIQQENRKFILEAIHGCSYEEALKKELGVGCKVIDKTHLFFGEPSPVEMTLVYGNAVDGEEFDTLYFLHLRGNPCVSFSKQVIFDKDRFEIIGKPLTLSRVLLAISKHGHYDYVWLAGERIDFEFYLKGVSFDLKKETLEEQTEETQRAINEFFNN